MIMLYGHGFVENPCTGGAAVYGYGVYDKDRKKNFYLKDVTGSDQRGSENTLLRCLNETQ
jgi:uncharacterized protein (DUF169 family)